MRTVSSYGSGEIAVSNCSTWTGQVNIWWSPTWFWSLSSRASACMKSSSSQLSGALEVVAAAVVDAAVIFRHSRREQSAFGSRDILIGSVTVYVRR
jgi:hypothetical protein